MFKKFLKKFKFYPELRRIFRVFFKYKKPLPYLYYRFIIKYKIKKTKAIFNHPVNIQDYSIHFLCSHNDLKMLFWAIGSWYLATEEYAQLYIHEDGSFTKKDKNLINNLIPQAKIVSYAWAKQKATQIWLKNYPHAENFRSKDYRYIYAIKMIDPYFVSKASARLILDTDVLWFRKPKQVLDLLRDRRYSFMMVGNGPTKCGSNYMEYAFKDGSCLPEEISSFNSGIVGYARESYSLETLEEFCFKNGINNPSRVIEQMGFIYILNKNSKLIGLDHKRYFIKGKVKPDTISKHYTGPRREEYWFEGIKLLNKIIKKEVKK